MHKSPQQKVFSTNNMFNSTEQFICPEKNWWNGGNELEMMKCTWRAVCEKLWTKTFSLEIDELTLPDNQALILIWGLLIKRNMSILFSTNFETDTKGSSIYNVVEIYSNENNILLTSNTAFIICYRWCIINGRSTCV